MLSLTLQSLTIATVRPFFWPLFQDITQRKQVESKLHQSEKQFRTLFNHMPIGLYRFAGDGSPVEVNLAMAQMLVFADQQEFFCKIFISMLRATDSSGKNYLLHAEQSGAANLK